MKAKENNIQKKTKKLSSKELSWVLYDVGNSAYTLLACALIPIWYKSLAVGDGAGQISSDRATAYYAVAIAVMTVVSALIGPVCGAIADNMRIKKAIFSTTVVVGVSACILNGFTPTWVLFLVIYVLTKIFYNASLVFYDSMLVDVTTKDRMDEVFDLIKNTEMTINIELKNGIVQYKNLEKKVLALVEEYDMLDRIWCSSFNHESIVRMKKLCPDMRCGLLFSDIIVNPAEYAGELHVDALHPATYHMQDENYIDKAHGRGLRAHVWTVNEKHEMKVLVKAEADAIITNYPDIAVEIVKNA